MLTLTVSMLAVGLILDKFRKHLGFQKVRVIRQENRVGVNTDANGHLTAICTPIENEPENIEDVDQPAIRFLIKDAVKVKILLG